MRLAGLFAGIGGIEHGFRAALGAGAVDTVLLCEHWPAANKVLRARFEADRWHDDIQTLDRIPARVDVLAAGFPCTDLSQAGRTAGIAGAQSGLVFTLLGLVEAAVRRRQAPRWLLIENVPNMLALGRGDAMRRLVTELEGLGYRWAYRVVDSRFTGVPQRRRRVILLASRSEDPRPVLFADDAGPRPDAEYRSDAFGFFWTEGLRGLGWAVDAVPTLKAGSTIGIPSPPAIWHVHGIPGRQFVTPTIEDAEQLQGFPRGWTEPATDGARRHGARWKLVGNAVTVDVAAWVAHRISEPGEWVGEAPVWDGEGAWPTAAYGDAGKVVVADVSEFPRRDPYRHLLELVDVSSAAALTLRGAAGFRARLARSNLGRYPGFREAIDQHLRVAAPDAAAG